MWALNELAAQPVGACCPYLLPGTFSRNLFCCALPKFHFFRALLAPWYMVWLFVLLNHNGALIFFVEKCTVLLSCWYMRMTRLVFVYPSNLLITVEPNRAMKEMFWVTNNAVQELNFLHLLRNCELKDLDYG